MAGGRRLGAPRGDTTRPTSERVRAALFNAVGSAGPAGLPGGLAGARVLDLFAGSGALGLEALSRGAARVTFVERHPAALAVLRSNVTAVGLPGAVVRAGDVAAVLAAGPGAGLADADGADLALLDPPYACAAEDVDALLGPLTRWLRPAAVVVVERDRRSPAPVAPPGLTVVGPRRYGDTTLWFLRADGATGSGGGGGGGGRGEPGAGGAHPAG